MRIFIFIITCIFINNLLLINCTEKSPTENDDIKQTLTDIDGNIYQTVKIGNQIWMIENLKVTHYRNGEVIPRITDDTEWSNMSTGAYCVYENDESNTKTYGYLYNWYAVVNQLNIAPEGWRVPTDADWQELEMYLGMSQSQADSIGGRGTNEGSKLAGDSSLWRSGVLTQNSAFETTKFDALPGGHRYENSGLFLTIGSTAYFWTASEHKWWYYMTPWDIHIEAWSRRLYFNASYIERQSLKRTAGLSLRLVRK